MADIDLSSAKQRADSKSPGSIPVPIGTKAAVTGAACNISNLTPAERAAREDS
ncbi:MAG TPA: hypothetical protein VFR49_14800 [Solirubrobacteraceae bacterium]|nr:hypothetical protein [Solirubrobacteraceae bacterium]